MKRTHFSSPEMFPPAPRALLRLFLWTSLLALAGCNRPPEIVQVGPYYIADAFVDFLKQDFSDRPGFSIYYGETIHFEVIAEDPDSDPITYSAGPLPHGATFDPRTAVFDWTPTLLDAQEENSWRELYLVAEDDLGAWDSVIVTLSVAPLEPPQGDEIEPLPGEG